MAKQTYQKRSSDLLTGDDELDRKRLNILLILNGLTKTEVARDLDVTPGLVTHTVNRRENNPCVLEYLENLPYQDLSEIAA